MICIQNGRSQKGEHRVPDLLKSAVEAPRAPVWLSQDGAGVLSISAVGDAPP
jgi:hypothetical protein